MAVNSCCKNKVELEVNYITNIQNFCERAMKGIKHVEDPG